MSGRAINLDGLEDVLFNCVPSSLVSALWVGDEGEVFPLDSPSQNQRLAHLADADVVVYRVVFTNNSSGSRTAALKRLTGGWVIYQMLNAGGVWHWSASVDGEIYGPVAIQADPGMYVQVLFKVGDKHFAWVNEVTTIRGTPHIESLPDCLRAMTI
jgi:hypothetical protein